MNGKNLFLAGLIGGVAIAALSNIPIIRIGNCLLCMWVWVGGIFAAWLYKRFQGSLTPGQGAGVGALAGVIAGLIGIVIGLLGFAGTQAALSAASQYLGPEVTGGVDVASLAGPLAIVGGFFNLILFTIFGTLGGLIAGSIFNSKPEAVPAYTPPPAPAYVPPPAPAYVPPVAPITEPVVSMVEETLPEQISDVTPVEEILSEQIPDVTPVEEILPEFTPEEPAIPPADPDQPAV